VLPWLWRRLEGYVRRPIVPPPAEPPEPTIPTPEGVFHVTAVRYLDIQVSTNDILDTKSANVVWIGSVVLPVTFGLLSLGQAEVPRWADVLLVLSLASYALLLVASWWASLLRGLEYRPYIPTLAEHSAILSGEALQLWAAQEYMDSSEANKGVLLRKARLVGAANTLLYLEGFFLSLAALLTLL
jgi:hypothetical protein